MEKMKKTVRTIFGIDFFLLVIYSFVNFNVSDFSILLLLLCIVNLVFMLLLRKVKNDTNYIFFAGLINSLFSIMMIVSIVNICNDGIKAGVVYITGVEELALLYIKLIISIFYTTTLLLPLVKQIRKKITCSKRSKIEEEKINNITSMLNNELKKEDNNIKNNHYNMENQTSKTVLSEYEIKKINSIIKRNVFLKKHTRLFDVLHVVMIVVFLPLVIIYAGIVLPIIEKINPKSFQEKTAIYKKDIVLDKTIILVKNSFPNLNNDKTQYLEDLLLDFSKNKKYIVDEIEKAIVDVIEEKLSIDEFESCIFLLQYFKKIYKEELTRLDDIEDICHPGCFVIEVSFERWSQKTYFYIGTQGYHIDDKVIVQTQNTNKVAIVISSRYYSKNKKLPFPYSRMKKVISLAPKESFNYGFNRRPQSTINKYIEREIDNNPPYNPWEDVPTPFYDDDGDLIGYDMDKSYSTNRFDDYYADDSYDDSYDDYYDDY